MTTHPLRNSGYLLSTVIVVLVHSVLATYALIFGFAYTAYDVFGGDAELYFLGLTQIVGGAAAFVGIVLLYLPWFCNVRKYVYLYIALLDLGYLIILFFFVGADFAVFPAALFIFSALAISYILHPKIHTQTFTP